MGENCQCGHGFGLHDDGYCTECFGASGKMAPPCFAPPEDEPDEGAEEGQRGGEQK